ncbi:MAG TPA: branched-chain amino acid ABC transporter substrate-binding protein [Jatrophihabitantaceae bacterium]|nr:branched-chain amino acid ABC transporter substrate-binding protein [Jatrophihabitantaceae bacterium]
MRYRSIMAAVVAVAVTALSLTACKSSKSSSGGTTGSTSAGGGGGGSAKTLVISTDLPMQGASADASTDTIRAIQLYLDQVNHKAGNYTIQLKTYDDSTAAAGKWDEATCANNAQAHVANTNEVAVMGTYNSGCAKIEVPVLNAAPMLMISHANTNPGLTKKWDPGEPDKYYPSGKRNYARVVTTDDYQGAAAADFASQDLKVKRVFVLNDNETYGQGVATAFVNRAKTDGLTILGNKAWDAKQPSYAAIFQNIKTMNPDMIYVGGIYDNNGGQLVKDKVSVLGDNNKVKFMAPDGFVGYPQLRAQPQAQGMYLSFAGLSTEQLIKGGGAGAQLINAYKQKYGSEPRTDYALYGVAAVQAILAAISKSDGTRQGVINQVFSGSGVDIPASQSVLGKEIKIDPQTGDTNNKDISILLEKNGQDSYLKAQPVT